MLNLQNEIEDISDEMSYYTLTIKEEVYYKRYGINNYSEVIKTIVEYIDIKKEDTIDPDLLIKFSKYNSLNQKEIEISGELISKLKLLFEIKLEEKLEAQKIEAEENEAEYLLLNKDYHLNLL
jgi:hypothetical protein